MPCCARMQFQAQCGSRRLLTRSHGTKSNSPAMAFLGRQLQAPACLVVKRLSPEQHGRAGTRGQRLLGRPEYFAGIRGPNNEHARQIDAALLQRRWIRLERWRYPGNPAGLTVVRLWVFGTQAAPMPASANAIRQYHIVQSGFQSAPESASPLRAGADPVPGNRWPTLLSAAPGCVPARHAGSAAICRGTMTTFNAAADRRE